LKYLDYLEEEITPILCIGETKEQKDSKKTKSVLLSELNECLSGINNNDIIIAYEPIWAIGTGKTATSEDANNSIKEIRNKIAEIYGQEVANGVIIQYGGRVKSTNAKKLFSMSDIDGGLVGGASLKEDKWNILK